MWARRQGREGLAGQEGSWTVRAGAGLPENRSLGAALALGGRGPGVRGDACWGRQGPVPAVAGVGGHTLLEGSSSPIQPSLVSVLRPSQAEDRCAAVRCARARLSWRLPDLAFRTFLGEERTEFRPIPGSYRNRLSWTGTQTTSGSSAIFP